MGHVTPLFARKMVAATGDRIDASHLLTEIGIDPDGAWDPKEMVPAAEYYDMLERIAAQTHVTELLLRTGASMHLDEYGALGLAFKAATTLGAACARVGAMPGSGRTLWPMNCARIPSVCFSPCKGPDNAAWACGFPMRQHWQVQWQSPDRSALCRSSLLKF